MRSLDALQGKKKSRPPIKLTRGPDPEDEDCDLDGEENFDEPVIGSKIRTGMAAQPKKWLATPVPKAPATPAVPTKPAGLGATVESPTCTPAAVSLSRVSSDSALACSASGGVRAPKPGEVSTIPSDFFELICHCSREASTARRHECPVLKYNKESPSSFKCCR